VSEDVVASRTDRGIVGMLSVLILHWRAIAGGLVAGSVLGALAAFIVPATYTATTTFVPESGAQGRLPSGIASLAGQIGITLGSEATQSPRFYAEVAQSRDVLERVLQTFFADPRPHRAPGDSITLLRLIRIRAVDFPDSLERGVRRLRSLVRVTVDNQTRIVRLSFESRYPTIAAGVANQFVQYLNDFNAKTRQSQARERRKFVQERLDNAEVELRKAEDDVKGFYQRNRSWQQSPTLVFEEGRLRRQVDIRQELYLTLKREYETARIEEVNDTPVITVIAAAAVPRRKAYLKASTAIPFGAFLAFMLALLWAFGVDSIDRARRMDPDEYREFMEHLKGLRDSVPTFLRALFKRSS
jgi:uncharacterized protein involved in exopolysaccharide biosynthesis